MDADDVPEEARKEIASAVRSALAKHGYANLTTSRIAEQTQKSEAFLFYHCDTKDELVVVFLEEAISWLDRHLGLVTSENPDERLREICDTVLVLDGNETVKGLDIAVMDLLSHAPHNEALRDPLRKRQRYVRGRTADEIRAGVKKVYTKR